MTSTDQSNGYTLAGGKIYLDDHIIFNDTLDQDLKHTFLDSKLNRLKEAKLIQAPEKCSSLSRGLIPWSCSES